MKRFQFTFLLISFFIFTMTPSLFAAPIGIPGATVGANKSVIGPELNFVFDRDLSGTGSVESTQVFAKGEVGLTDRIDLDIRLGFGQFKVKDVPGGANTDIGPAFGVGFKATWAQIPDANIKIGTVLQTVRLRAKDNGNRFGWSEYDAALGAYLDAGPRSPRAGQASLIPYGGVVWSGLDLDGRAAEDNTFGIFLGLAARVSNFYATVELRVPEQTALGINAGFSF